MGCVEEIAGEDWVEGVEEVDEIDEEEEVTEAEIFLC